jgi:alkylation response protein AidB-like acyl-CoA dehydrogenase
MAYDVNEIFPYPVNMLDDDARVIAATVHQWADKEIINKRLEYLKGYSELFNERSRSYNLDLGFQRIVFPEKHGGSGFNTPGKMMTLVAVLIELGRADASIGFMSALQHALSAVVAIEPNVNTDICKFMGALLCGEHLKTVSIIMPGPGRVGQSGPLFMGRAVDAHVKERDGGYCLNADALRPVGNGAIADVYGVVCSNQKGKTGIAFVDANVKGVLRAERIKQTGLDGCHNADITFNDVMVPFESVILNDCAVRELYTWLNLFLGAVSVGAGLNFYEILRDWSENRVIKGNGLLKNNPLCASVLAEVVEEISMAKILLYSMNSLIGRTELWGDGNNMNIFVEAEMFGKRIQKSMIYAINRGMELMASAGYAREWHAEKHWRDVKTIQSVLSGVGAGVPAQMDIARYFYDSAEI